VELRPGGRTDDRRHGGDVAMHVLAGTLNVLLTEGADPQGRRWFELHPDDGFFVPEGTSYALHNVTDTNVEAMVAVAPSYDPR
jgi:quercetin dioxygenase-like cupin family protein